jgi:hypothetical protein
VYRQVAAAVEQANLQFLGKKTFVPNFGQGYIQDDVSLGGEGVELQR